MKCLMLAVIFASVIALAPLAAHAQAPQPDTTVIYRTLLTDANERLVQTIARYEKLVADLKAKCGKACEQAKPEASPPQ